MCWIKLPNNSFIPPHSSFLSLYLIESDPNSDHTSIHPLFWELVASLSGVVALICYPMNSSFRTVFGEIDSDLLLFDIKFVLYCNLNFIVLFGFLYRVNTRGYEMRIGHAANLGFLVLILTSWYSVCEEKGTTAELERGFAITMYLLLSAIGCVNFNVKERFETDLVHPRSGSFRFLLGLFSHSNVEDKSYCYVGWRRGLLGHSGLFKLLLISTPFIHGSLCQCFLQQPS